MDDARENESETTRLEALLEVIARLSDRTRKGRRPEASAFRITRRYEDFETVKTSGVLCTAVYHNILDFSARVLATLGVKLPAGLTLSALAA